MIKIRTFVKTLESSDFIRQNILKGLLLKDMDNYKLSTIAEHFSIDYPDHHRALKDCEVTNAVYMKLKEMAFAKEE